MAVLLPLACKGDPRIAQARDVVRAANTVSQLAPKIDSAGKLVRLYVDNSESMKGFGTCESETGSFAARIDAIADALGLAAFTAFAGGKDEGFTDRVIARTAFCPERIGGLTNPDYLLYQRIALDSAAAASVYVTDGVQSDSSGTVSALTTRELRAWVEAGHAVGIFVLRGTFKGMLWSERSGCWIDRSSVCRKKGDVVQPISSVRRPFYAVVFARTDATLSRVAGRLRAGALSNAEAYWAFSRDALACRIGFDSVRVVRKYPPDPLVEIRVPRDSAVTAELKCENRGGLPLVGVQVEVLSTYSRWGGSAFSEVIDEGRFATWSKPTGPSWNIAIGGSFRPDTAEMGLHLVRVSLTTPLVDSTVNLLSNEDDSKASTVESTFRLQWLVRALADPVVKHALSNSAFGVVATR